MRLMEIYFPLPTLENSFKIFRDHDEKEIKSNHPRGIGIRLTQNAKFDGQPSCRNVTTRKVEETCRAHGTLARLYLFSFPRSLSMFGFDLWTF